MIDTREHASVIGVHFRPGGAFPFLGTDWGVSALELRERLCAAITPAERFSLLEKALAAYLVRPAKRHHAVRFALNVFVRPEFGLTVHDVAREAELSQRRFIQLFAREVGMSPKQFCRVQRFQQTLKVEIA